MKPYELSFPIKLKIFLQRILGNIAFLIYGVVILILIKFVYKYKVLNHKQHKEFFQSLFKEKQRILICSNHLTMIDSVILQYAFGDYWTYLFLFRRFPWNVPAREVFFRNFWINLFLFLSKCIPLDRKGSPEHHELILNQTKYILSQYEPFIIFPEGGRSRKGRFDIENITYGVGRILLDLPGTKVLCVYLRGDKQEHFTNFPPKGSVFYLSYRLIEPKTSSEKRLVAEKELAMQVGQVIKELEDEYFENYKNIITNKVHQHSTAKT
ncbi:MAG: 1-acyl-sn-glycerol-3-phosphate acyltransferase [Leptospiraceae bacterium]|nr:1-acyl-sn-glycerol-3-phosphate acyltransferase [Leptospiraceae bacterium]MDW7975840.1 1-acyl-sn-glycerol-3-phosphate acyltransferase [Leptospiraceae bacterium]